MVLMPQSRLDGLNAAIQAYHSSHLVSSRAPKLELSNLTLDEWACLNG